MEVLASVILFQLVVAVRLIVQYHISSDRNIPEYVKMSKNDNEPMQNKFEFLLHCNFGPRGIHTSLSVSSTIHWGKELLSRVRLHVDVSCLHGLEGNCHGSRGRGPFEHLRLVEERWFSFDRICVYFLRSLFSVSPWSYSFNHRNQNNNNKSNCHFTVKNVSLSSNEGLWVNCEVLESHKNITDCKKQYTCGGSVEVSARLLDLQAWENRVDVSWFFKEPRSCGCSLLLFFLALLFFFRVVAVRPAFPVIWFEYVNVHLLGRYELRLVLEPCSFNISNAVRLKTFLNDVAWN